MDCITPFSQEWQGRNITKETMILFLKKKKQLLIPQLRRRNVSKLTAVWILKLEVWQLLQSGKVTFIQTMTPESLVLLPLADEACGVVHCPAFDIQCVWSYRILIEHSFNQRRHIRTWMSLEVVPIGTVCMFKMPPPFFPQLFKKWLWGLMIGN